MRLYSYVIDHDHGFAPNPFFGVCTLATCKPAIRATAAVGDYVVGTGCAKRRRRGFLVYFMRVDEILTYNSYWTGPRFAIKRPFFQGSRMRCFGDNIYHRDHGTGDWKQASSFHSMHDGTANPLNVTRDTRSDRVLISHDFAYWGGSGPRIPAAFRDYDGDDICAGRGHRVNFAEDLVSEFVAWLRSLGTIGQVGAPLEWSRRS